MKKLLKLPLQTNRLFKSKDILHFATGKIKITPQKNKISLPFYFLQKIKNFPFFLVQRFLRSVCGTGTGRQRTAQVGTGRLRHQPALTGLDRHKTGTVVLWRSWYLFCFK
jgi:hypothetical protein